MPLWLLDLYMSLLISNSWSYSFNILTCLSFGCHVALMTLTHILTPILSLKPRSHLKFALLALLIPNSKRRPSTLDEIRL